MKLAADFTLRVVGVLLLVAAGLKGWQLLTEPLANSDIWSNRAFLILTVEFELGLGIWLVSGLLKKLAWAAGVACFVLFSGVTLYKGVTGAASCGCFGSVEVNPWITLFAVDLPCLAALVVFRVRHGQIFEWPELPRFAATAAIGILVLGITAPVLAFNEPARVTARYEILEPGDWVGKELPILEHIDIGERLKAGNWLVLLYHYDCPGCAEAIPMYERMARDLAGNEDFLRIAFIAVPPYGQAPVSPASACILGKLNESKEWFVTTPAVALLGEGKVTSAWEETAPNFETILQTMSNPQSNSLCVKNIRDSYQHY